MLIYLCLMAEAFFGYLLPWGNMSYWGAQVIVSLFGAIPCIGELARRVDPRRLLHLGRHAEPVLRAARRPRCRSRSIFLVDRAHPGAARGRLEQPGRRRDQEGQGSGRPSRSTASRSIRTTRSRTLVGRRRVPDRCSASSCSSRRRWAATSSSTRTSTRRTRCRRREHIAPVWYFTPFYAILRAVPNKLGRRRSDGRRGRAAGVRVPAVARSRQGPVDPLPRADLQGFADRRSRSASSRSATSGCKPATPDLHACRAGVRRSSTSRSSC